MIKSKKKIPVEKWVRLSICSVLDIDLVKRSLPAHDKGQEAGVQAKQLKEIKIQFTYANQYNKCTLE